MTELQERLFALADNSYAQFQAELIPTVPAGSVIGVRVPILRKFAKEFAKTQESVIFLQELPHTFYDENMLHAILLGLDGNFEHCLALTEQFLPFVDNWAVCDSLRLKIRNNEKNKLLQHIEKWVRSPEIYTCRFGIETLMREFLDADFSEEYLDFPLRTTVDDYYVRMMVAWFFATALAKQWDASVLYLQENRLDEWTHNKTIQKAVESYRITDEQKKFLRTLKR